MGKLIMGYWDCQYCGNKGIPGDTRECTTCGHPRDESVKFYLKDNNYVSEEKAASVSRKPDWYCSYCNTLNNSENEFCESCGAPRSESEKNYFTMRSSSNTGSMNLRSNHSDDEDDLDSYEQALHKSANKSGSGSKKFFIILALIIAGLVAIFAPRKKDVEVTRLDWERNIQIEQYTDVYESDWSLPQGATLHDTKLEIHHYDHILDHYDEVTVQKSREVLDGYDTHTRTIDLGNGYFEEETYETPRYRTEYYTETESVPVYRDDPVYAKKYYYDIWKWVPSRNVSTSGNGHNAYWGDLNLSDNEREGAHSEKYSVTFTGKNDKTYTYELLESEWNKFEIGQKYKIKVQTGSNQFEIIY